ncbi:MAG TPA: GerMN domain-containing protein [Spirochaetota bacterium]|nr:GerMN domain-containing protein [Spirochaetota bacterium]
MAQPKKSGSKPGKSAAGAGKGKKISPAAAQTGGTNRAFYILVIIILVTVIVLLVNRYADKGMFRFPVMMTDKAPAEKKKDKKEDETGSSKTAAGQKDVKPVDQAGKNNPDIKTAQDKDITIYLLKLDEKSEKIYLSQVKRRVRNDRILESAIESLIKGPTADEKNRGYITAVPDTLKLRSVNIRGRTAEIDFSGSIEESAAGDIVIKRVQQIVYTATQFDDVESIVILINGKKRNTLGSDGFSISGPLRR